jgi:long-chain fatty acid transport protein
MLKGSALAAAVFLASQATAGGFDNSDRSLDILFGEDNVITTSFGQTSVPMGGTIEQGAGSNVTIQSGDVVGNFVRPEVAFRYSLTEDVTCATKYEKPFSAEVDYGSDGVTYDTQIQGTNAAIPTTVTAPAMTEYKSESLTVACGYDLALDTGKLTFVAGPKLQEVKGGFTEDLSSADLGAADDLSVSLDGGMEVGYVVGAAFSIPEIALRASIMYHSEIDYTATGQLSAVLPSALPGAAGGAAFTTDATANTFTPQMVEIKLQSGIAENTLASLKLRWSEYSKLAELDIQGDSSTRVAGQELSTWSGLVTADLNSAHANADTGLTFNDALNGLYSPTVSMFSNDTLDYTLGLGRRINDKLSLGASFGGSIKIGSKDADTPIGADSTSLRLPGDTAHTVSFGGEYAVMKNLKVSGGLGYTFINAYVVQEKDNSFKAEFDKTEATSFQMAVSYAL